jgi:hypothetical protein
MELICKNMLWVELLHVMVLVELLKNPLATKRKKNTKEVGSFILINKPSYVAK